MFDPLTHKVVEVAPINIGTQSAQVSQPKVVLRNGTTKTGLTNTVETQLKKDLPSINIVDKENAAKTDYSKTLIWLLNDSAKDLAASLSTLLKADVVREASGESKPKDGDIVVILGKDKI